MRPAPRREIPPPPRCAWRWPDSFRFRRRRRALLQLAFEKSIFRRGEPRGQPDVAEQLAALHELAFEKGAAFRAGVALVGQLAVTIHFVKRLHELVGCHDEIYRSLKNAI